MGKAELNSILKVARSYVGKEFRPGVTAQCANFVRQVFEDAGCYVGVAAHPTDEKLLPIGEPQGASYANSFSGDDVGRKITDVYSLLPGDIVMFKNTYGNYGEGVITHVGIMTSPIQMVHRPTASKPVQRVDIQESEYWFSHFKEGRRLDYLDADQFDKIKIYFHDNAVTFFPSSLGGVRIKMFSHDGKTSCNVQLTTGTSTKSKNTITKKVKTANIKTITLADKFNQDEGSEVYHILYTNGKYKLYDSCHLIKECFTFDCTIQNGDYKTRNLILKTNEDSGLLDLSACEAVIYLE